MSKPPKATDKVVDDDGVVLGNVGWIVRGAAMALLGIADDPVKVNRLLANDKICGRVFRAIEAAEEYVEGGDA